MLAALPSCRSFRVLLQVAGPIRLARVAWLLVMLAVSRTSVARVIPPITTALPNAEVWGRSSHPLTLAAWDDPECITGCQHPYFNLQGLIVDDNAIPTGGALPGELLRGNMQGEYR